MIINFRKARCLVAARKSQGSLTIVPGVNILDDKDWEDIKDSLKDRTGEGKDITTVVKVSKGPGGKEVVTPVKVNELDPVQAETLIQSVASLDVIKKWLKLDSRDGVRAQLFERQAEIQAATAPATKD